VTLATIGRQNDTEPSRVKDDLQWTKTRIQHLYRHNESGPYYIRACRQGKEVCKAWVNWSSGFRRPREHWSRAVESVHSRGLRFGSINCIADYLVRMGRLSKRRTDGAKNRWAFPMASGTPNADLRVRYWGKACWVLCTDSSDSRVPVGFLPVSKAPQISSSTAISISLPAVSLVLIDLLIDV